MTCTYVGLSTKWMKQLIDAGSITSQRTDFTLGVTFCGAAHAAKEPQRTNGSHRMLLASSKRCAARKSASRRDRNAGQ